MANLFTTATVVAKGKGKEAKKPSVVELEGVELLSAVDHAQKWLKSLCETIKGNLKDTVTAKFIADGITKKGKPENFNAKEGDGTANIQLRQRPSNSALNEVEQAICTEYNVPTGTGGGRLFFNPEHIEWVMKNSDKLSKAFAKIPGCPEKLLLQEEETVITTEESLDYVFKAFAGKPETIEKLLPVVGVLAYKPKFNEGGDDEERNSTALAVIKGFLDEAEADED